MKKIIIAGTNSGCGKTTVSCAVMSALCRRGLTVTSFKCGPDYIDPMFHSKVIGTSAHNLDSFFCDDNTIVSLLCENGGKGDISVIEGVMGYYDDVGGRGSAYSIAKITDTPAVIVIDCKGMSGSLGAVMKGFLTYRENSRVVGFIFNRLPVKLVPLAKKLCSELKTVFFGYFPVSDITVESRHLGLVTADEIVNIKEKMLRLGELAEKHIDIDKIIEMSESSVSKLPDAINRNIAINEHPIIAVSKDEAFCFLYSDNIDILEKLGCRIVYFSPVNDDKIPENADGLILCGGYPELHAKELAENHSMKNSIYEAIKNGLPVIAECGGFMYLNKAITVDGRRYEMVGFCDGEVYGTKRLQRFGYITMTAHEDNLLCQKGEKIKAHEFHYWDSTSCGNGFTAEKNDGRTWECCHISDTVYAGFPHLYFGSDTGMAERFVRKCAEYGGKNERSQPDQTF